MRPTGCNPWAWLSVFVGVAALWVWVSPAKAQRHEGGPTWAGEGPAVEESASIAHLLRTADDAIGRADWKLAIDSLQRVIDKPEGLMRVERGEEFVLYQSPRRHAQRRLAALPPEGVAAYRVLYDGRAKGLLKRARREFDLEALKHVCDHYLVTRYGTPAAGLLASWLLDFGRESESLRVLENLAAVYSESSSPTEGEASSGQTLPPKLELKRALALALLGDRRGARSALDQAREGDTHGLQSAGLESSGQREVADAVEAFIEQAFSSARASREPRTGWSGPGGGGACDGLMDHVIPSFAENLPWRRPIPSSAVPGIWPDLDELAPNMLPVIQPVAAEGRMFVKSGRECLAIDIQSFAILWTSQSSVEGIAERAERRSPSSMRGERALLLDYVGGSLSTSHGLVFSIEHGDPGPSFGPQGLAVLQRGRIPSRNQEPDDRNRLVAFDARTGKIHWQRGRGRDPDERLQQAQFLCPPIGVGNHLWVPFEASGDLYVGVLNPSDGELMEPILLCALAGRRVQPTVALFPAASDELVYIPTGHGLLFAVDVNDFSIAWATRYRASPVPKIRRRTARVREQPPGWLSGPPVIAGRLVLLAPTDLDQLLAFDRLTGDLLWRLPRGRHRYIIATDSDQVWLGGEEVSAVSLWDRSYEWTLPTTGATGRAVLSGETIYVPTREHLLVIDANLGRTNDPILLPSDQTPLGNLLCIGGSMLSVDPSEVRAFPDRNSYAATLAAHQADPTDTRIAIRLAFMELLENRPQGALDALREAMPTDDRSSDPDAESQAAHIAHLRVGALLQLSKVRATPGDQAIGYLKEAVAAAMSNGDLVAARLELGEKLGALGRYAESYRTLWRLGRSPLGDEIIARGKARRPTRLIIAELLGRVEPELGPTEVDDLSREAGRLFDTAVSQLETYPNSRDGNPWTKGIGILRRLADSGTLDGWQQRALNALGRFELRRKKYERAEQYLNESLRRGSRRAETAEALLTLMNVYIGPSQPLAKSALDLAKTLLIEFGDVVLDEQQVGVLVAPPQLKIDQSLAAAHADAMDVPKFEVTWPRTDSVLSKASSENMQLMYFRGRRTEALAERQLVFLPPRTLRSYRIEDGKLEWETELLTEEDFVFGRDDQGTSEGLVGADLRPALVDGQMVIVNGPRGLHAVGIISGIRLWAEPVQGPVLLRDRLLRDRTIDVGSGLVACVLSPGVLSVRRVLDGKLVWERDLGANPAAVRIRDEFVLTADPNLETVWVYHLENGAALSAIAFTQPGSDSFLPAVPISYSAGVLCGPDGQAVMAYDARTGDHLWSLELGEDVAGIFELLEGQFVVGTVGGFHRVIEARSGEVILEEGLEDLPGGAIYGTVESNLMILAGYEETGEGDRWNLVGIDMSTGKVRWSRRFVGVMNRSHLRLARGVIPVITTSGQPPERPQLKASRRYRQEVLLIDKQTGQLVGDPLIWNGAARGDQLTGDLAVWPGRLVLQASKSIVTYQTRPATSDAGGVN